MNFKIDVQQPHLIKKYNEGKGGEDVLEKFRELQTSTEK